MTGTADVFLKNMKRRRIELDKSFVQLSEDLERAGYSLSDLALGRIEGGKRRITIEDLTAIAYALQCTPNELLYLPDEESRLDGVPDDYFPDEVEAWLRGEMPLDHVSLEEHWREVAQHEGERLETLDKVGTVSADFDQDGGLRALIEDAFVNASRRAEHHEERAQLEAPSEKG